MPPLSVDVRFRRANGFALDVKLLTSEGVTALFGPSGSGKSTLLHLIAGVLQEEFGPPSPVAFDPATLSPAVRAWVTPSTANAESFRYPSSPTP